MKRYVLTGGPGTGKSSIIFALEMQGEHVVREAAEDYIRLRQAQGQAEPWTEPDFQMEILKLQLKRESEVPFAAYRAFIDRGIPDGLAYTTPGTETYNSILRTTLNREKYNGVFLIENLGATEKTDVRREGYEEAIELGEKLELVYRELGYSPIRIFPGTVSERAEQIIAAVQEKPCYGYDE